jgi:hypothetical protein
MSSIFGTTYGESGYFAGGGAGSTYYGNVNPVGGIGGGGDGYHSASSGGSGTATAGAANTGGGSGGDKLGGSGIVIVRYAV